MKSVAQLFIECPHCSHPAKVVLDLPLGLGVWTDSEQEAATRAGVTPVAGQCRKCDRFFWVHRAPRILRDHPRASRPVKTPSGAQYLDALSTAAANDPGDELSLRVLAWQASTHPIKGGSAVPWGCGPAAVVLASVFWIVSTKMYGGRTLPLPSIILLIFGGVMVAMSLLARLSARRAIRQLQDENSRARQNLVALFEMLSDANPHQRLQKAEAARQLGRFEESLKFLKFDWPPELARLAAFIAERTRANDTIVRRLPIAP